MNEILLKDIIGSINQFRGFCYNLDIFEPAKPFK